MARRRRYALLALIVLLGALRVYYYVVSYGTNVPTGDDWDLLRTLLRWRTDGIDASSLLAFHNEHRIVATRLIGGAVLPPAHGNMRVALLVNATMVAATSALVVSFFASLRAHAIFVAATTIAVVALLTGWFQWQNLIWSFQLPWLLLPLLLVASVWCICFVRQVSLCVVLTAALLVAALGCLSNGIVVWVAVLPAVLMRRARDGVASTALTIGIGLAVVALAAFVYTRGFPDYVARPRIGEIAEHPATFARFFLSTLGSPFSAPLAVTGPVPRLGVVVAIASCAATLLCLPAALRHARARREPALLSLGFALLLFGGLSVAAITVGRFTMFSPDQIESRYTTFAACFHAGLLTLVCALATSPRPIGVRTGSLRSAFLALCVSYAVAATWGDNILARHGTNLMLALSRVKATLNLAVALPEQAQLQGAAHTVPKAQIPAMLLSLERRDLWTPSPMMTYKQSDLRRDDDTGNVDSQESDGADETLRGWARLPNNLPADAVLAMLPGRDGALSPVAISSNVRIARPDVQAHFQGDSLLLAGWTLKIRSDDYARHPVVAAYSVREDRLYMIPYAWQPQLH